MFQFSETLLHQPARPVPRHCAPDLPAGQKRPSRIIKLVVDVEHDDVLITCRPPLFVEPVEILFVSEYVRPKRHHAKMPVPLRGQAPPASDPSSLYDIASVAGLHPFSKTVLFLSLPFFRLISHLHILLLLFFLMCPSSELQSGRLFHAQKRISLNIQSFPGMKVNTLKRGEKCSAAYTK